MRRRSIVFSFSALYLIFISTTVATTSFQEKVTSLNCVLSAEIEPMLHTQSSFETIVDKESYLLTVKTKKDSRKKDLEDCANKIQKKFPHHKIVEKSRLSNWLVVESY